MHVLALIAPGPGVVPPGLINELVYRVSVMLKLILT